MNEPRDSRESDADNESLAAALVAYDEALRGTAAGPPDSTAEPLPPVPAGARACLQFFERAWPRAAAAPSATALPGRIGRFEVERLLGQGGFGVVYLARDPRLGRRVALKIPRPHVLANAELHERFLREARAAAALDHANIIPILETGEAGPICYIASAYCEGPTLAEWLKSRTIPVVPAVAARIVGCLADAAHYSHNHGILHRDLKPSNVLLAPVSAEGNRRNGDELPFVPRITDFGLAKVSDDVLDETAASVLMGTPLYMAPEYATGAGHRLGPAADIYSLGVILYELLIGRPPFQGLNVVDVVDQARHANPVAPRRLRSDVPRDLETICLKCLEKRPDRRYESAEALADDLAKFLSGRPTVARPLTPLARGWRWVQRYPERTALIGTLLTALIVVVAVSTRYADRLELARERSRLQELNLTAARIRERSLNRPTAWQRDNLAELKAIAPSALDENLRLDLRNEAIRALSAVRLERAAVLLEDFDGFAVAYSPDARHLAVGCNVNVDGQGLVVVFDAETRRETRRLTFDPAPGISQRTRARDRTEGVRSLLFAADGRRLFVGTRGGMIHVWDVDSGEPVRTAWQAHDSSVWGLGLMEKFEVLVSIPDDSERKLRFWRVSSAECLATFASSVSLSVNVATVGNRAFIIVGNRLMEHQFDHRTWEVTRGWRAACAGSFVALMPDGRALVAENDKNLAVFDLADGDAFRSWTDPRHKRVHDGPLHAMQVSGDGRWLLTTANEGLKLWDLSAGAVAAVIPHSANCRVSAAFHPRKAELAITREGRVEVWAWSNSGVWQSEIAQSYSFSDMDLSADGRTLAATVRPGRRNHTSAEQCALTADLRERNAPVQRIERASGNLACSDHGRFLAFEVPNSGIGQFDRVSGVRRIVVPSSVLPSGYTTVFSPREEQLWYSGVQPLDRGITTEIGSVSVGFLAAIDTSSGKERFRWANERSAIELRPSGFQSFAVGDRYAAGASSDDKVRLFDAKSGALVWEHPLEGQIVDAVCLSQDERWVYCGTRQCRLVALATADGAKRFDFVAHDEPVKAVVAANDGLVITAAHDGVLIAWRLDWGAPEELFRIGPLGGVVHRAVLSRDGSLLAVLIENETCVRLLHMAELRSRLAELGLDWK